MEGNYQLLRMELSELNACVRDHFELHLGWYTSFLTVNFAAIGWFTGSLPTGALKDSLPIIFVASFFLVQSAPCYLGSWEVPNYLIISSNRSKGLLDFLVAQPPDPPLRPQSAIPIQVYSRVLRLICSTLISFIFFWLALTVVSIYLVPIQRPAGRAQAHPIHQKPRAP